MDPLGRTPLIYACQLGNERWVRDLLDAGADIQALDSDGFSCIHAAAYSGRLEILRHLLPLRQCPGDGLPEVVRQALLQLRGDLQFAAQVGAALRRSVVRPGEVEGRHACAPRRSKANGGR